MIDYLAPYKLLKEARESWDYLVTDELVYAIQDCDVVNSGRYCGYLQAYLKREVWLEFCVGVSHVRGQLCYYFGLIEFDIEPEANRTLGGHDELGNRMRLDDKSVVGLIGQLPEDREQVGFRPIRSIVRLHPLNFWKGSRQNIGNLLWCSPRIAFKGITDGELSLSRGLTVCSSILHMLNGQFPSHVIQCRPKVAGKIRSDKPPRGRSSGRPTVALPPMLIFLGDFLEGCGSILEFGDASLEAAEVYLRPVSLDPSIIQGVGGWNHW